MAEANSHCISHYLDEITELLQGEFFSFWYTEINKKSDDTWAYLFAARDLMRANVEALHFDIDRCAETVLGVYGFMQALFLQQNALIDMHKCITGKGLDVNLYKSIKKARDIRNYEIAGHPLKQGNEQRYNVLASHLIQDWTITICDHAKGLTQNAVVKYDLLEIRDKQEQEISSILADLSECCHTRQQAHKEKFMHTKLGILFNGLCLSRIMQAIASPTVDNRYFAEAECSLLKEKAQNFLNLVAERGEEPSNYEDDINEFIWGLEHINQLVGGEENKLHACLLWRGLNSLFNDLKGYAEEIDARYAL